MQAPTCAPLNCAHTRHTVKLSRAMEEMSGNVQNAALTCCDAEIKSTRATAGQFKGQFKGAMERYTWVRFAGKLTPCHTT